MPSLDLEGFGLATVESLACGTPVLGSDAGATPELLGPLDNQLLYSACDPTALTRTLTGLLNGSQRLPDRERCSDYARTAFPWERPVNAFESAWNDVLTRGGKT
jgi:glycosyltransferase involved in cell wall biosynthesis